MRRSLAIRLLITACLLVAACGSATPSAQPDATPSSGVPGGSLAPGHTPDPCVSAVIHLGTFTARLAGDLAALRRIVLASPFSSQAAATANFRVSATLTAIDGDGLVAGLTRCQATRDLAARLSKVLDTGQAAVKAAKTYSTSDAGTQQGAAAALFGLLPEVLAISSANATIAAGMALTDQVAVVPSDLDARPLGSLPPLPTSAPPARGTPPPSLTPPTVPNEGLPTVQTSTYYAGYGAQHLLDDVSSVTGSWTQPTGTCSGTKATGFGSWVGIEDGSNLQQIGTAVDCDRGSAVPAYFVWYEMFPKLPVDVAMRARPGDRFTATVSRSGDRWTLAIRNRTTGQRFSTSQTRATAGFIALWINEAPSSQVSEAGRHVLPLTKVTPVTMTDCSATIAGVRLVIGSPDWAHYRFDMVTATGVAKTTTSGLTSGGTSFKTTWRHE